MQLAKAGIICSCACSSSAKMRNEVRLLASQKRVPVSEVPVIGSGAQKLVMSDRQEAALELGSLFGETVLD